MKPSRPLVAVAVAALLSLAACSSGSTGTGTSGGPGGGGLGAFGTGGNPGSPGAANPGSPGGGLGGLPTGAGGGSATCDDACAYYLQCKGDGWYTQANQASCVQTCSGLGASPDQLAGLLGQSCAQAVCTIEGGAACGGASPSTPKQVDCTNCAWDGSSCIWLSPSTGLSSSCDASCCPGH
jgi:hypothetical protein